MEGQTPNRYSTLPHMGLSRSTWRTSAAKILWHTFGLTKIQGGRATTNLHVIQSQKLSFGLVKMGRWKRWVCSWRWRWAMIRYGLRRSNDGAKRSQYLVSQTLLCAVMDDGYASFWLQATKDVAVPAGQVIYITKDGALSLTEAHGEDITSLAYPNSFSYHDSSGSGGSSTLSGTPSKGRLVSSVKRAGRGRWMLISSRVVLRWGVWRLRRMWRGVRWWGWLWDLMDCMAWCCDKRWYCVVVSRYGHLCGRAAGNYTNYQADLEHILFMDVSRLTKNEITLTVWSIKRLVRSSYSNWSLRPISSGLVIWEHMYDATLGLVSMSAVILSCSCRLCADAGCWRFGWRLCCFYVALFSTSRDGWIGCMEEGTVRGGVVVRWIGLVARQSHYTIPSAP